MINIGQENSAILFQLTQFDHPFDKYHQVPAICQHWGRGWKLNNQQNSQDNVLPLGAVGESVIKQLHRRAVASAGKQQRA